MSLVLLPYFYPSGNHAVENKLRFSILATIYELYKEQKRQTCSTKSIIMEWIVRTKE